MQGGQQGVRVQRMMRAAMTHHVGQHPARTHGGQLVRVSDKQHARTMGQRPKQGTCHVPVWGRQLHV
jgi:hypothetical protein